MKVDKNFFARDTCRVAKDLLGMEIVRMFPGGKKLRGVIIETEAYKGFNDKASHASRGQTLRNTPMFAEPGTIYVYLIYGMYWCLNIVTEREKYPAAVLIRGVRILSDGPTLNGPGKFTREFKIDKTFNNENILKNSRFRIGRRIITSKRIKTSPRIGVPYAGEWATKKWRFFIE